MREAPEFFSRVETQARQRWHQLDADSGLAAPWHTLLRQVQNPRLVLSELLQNADDAGATWAEATIEGNTFIIRHDGRDFAPEEFAALCEFGLSSKRALLTTGFRGIGFKAVFALGDKVEVLTPTIAVQFERQRFTLPKWRKSARAVTGVEIRIPLTRPDAKAAVLQDLTHWSDNPLPLIFFRHLRRLKLQRKTLQATDLGPAPCAAGRRIRIDGVPGDLIILRSAPEAIPPDAAAELAEERGVPADSWPPCEVEVVLGARGRLYAVLPTDVVTEQPFACQAPFLLDPARTRIKEPVQSPMNRWLLGRIGTLVAEAISSWVNNRELSYTERSAAYRYLPVTPSSARVSLTDHASGAIVEGYQSGLVRCPVVLTSRGDVVTGPVTAVPRDLLRVWSSDVVERLFASPSTSGLLAPEVLGEHLPVLEALGHIEIAAPQEILDCIRNRTSRLPKPSDVERLLFLWKTVLDLTENSAYYRGSHYLSKLKLLPGAGKAELVTPQQALPPVSPPERVPKADWAFVLSRATLIDEAWASLMKGIEEDADGQAEQVSARLEHTVTPQLLQRILATYKVLELNNPKVESIIAQVASAIFTADDIRLPLAVRLTRIAAKANISEAAMASGHWRFLCRDHRWRSASDGILVDEGAAVTSLLPPGSADHRFLAAQYLKDLGTRDAKLFRTWATTKGRGGLDAFPKPVFDVKSFFGGVGYTQFRHFCEEHGIPYVVPPNKNGTVQIEDWDWPSEYWEFWEKRARKDPQVWVRLSREVLEAWSDAWDAISRRQYKQFRGSKTYLFGPEQPATWLTKLRERACLPDEGDCARRPIDLIRRTPDTSAFLNIEPVVALELDQPQYHRVLDVLGVRVSCRDAQPILDRIRHLTERRTPPELGRLREFYQALLRIYQVYADPAIQTQLEWTFRESALIWTDRGWKQSTSAYRSNNKKLPGMPVIHEAFRDLSPLWEGLEVADEPTVQDVLAWLSQVQTGRAFKDHDMDALRAVCYAYPTDAWRIIWPSLDGKPYRPKRFKYATISAGVGAAMTDDRKGVVADASMLDRVRFEELDTGLPLIEDLIEYSVRRSRPALEDAALEAPAWVQTVGRTIARCIPPTGEPDDILADRGAGSLLEKTVWHEVHSLVIVPTLEGQAVAHPQPADAAWLPEGIVVVRREGILPVDELANVLKRRFVTDSARHALERCIDRTPEWILSYFRQQGWQEAPEPVQEAPIDEPPVQEDATPLTPIFSEGDPLEIPGQQEDPGDPADEEHAPPPLPTSPAPDVSRRLAKAGSRAASSAGKRYEFVDIKRRVHDSAVDPRGYLRLHNTNENGDLVCQMCDRCMPFKLRGQDYFEAVQFWESFKRDVEANYLALCPNCAAEYKHGCKTPIETRLSRLNALDIAGDEAGMRLRLELPAHRAVRFTQRHLIDIRAAFELD